MSPPERTANDAPGGSHAWRTVARHRNEVGRTRHQVCACGVWRIVAGRTERWRSSEEPCTQPPPVKPRGWPHHKGWAESNFFE